MTWQEAFQESEYHTKCENYREGFRNGWLDFSLGYVCNIAMVSNLPHYTNGYVDGRRANFHQRELSNAA